MSAVRQLKTLHKCFIPNCSNSGTKTKNKLLIHVSRAVKRKWCEQVNLVYNPEKEMYCCEDHLDLNEDLENYYQWKFMQARPRLKPTATLKYSLENVLSHASVLTENESDIVQIESTNRSSELERMLMQPTENIPSHKKDKRSCTITSISAGRMQFSTSSGPPQSSPPPVNRLSTEDSASELGYSSDEPSTSKQSTEAIPSTSSLYTCHECKHDIAKSRFACVQCESYDVCMRCAASDVHENHYLLRVPKHSTQEETVFVLQAVHAQLKVLLSDEYKQINVTGEIKDTIGESEVATLHSEVTIKEENETIGKEEDVEEYEVIVKSEPKEEEDPLGHDVLVEYCPPRVGDAEGDPAEHVLVKSEPHTDKQYDDESPSGDEPESKKAKLSDDDKSRLQPAAVKLQVVGAPSASADTKNSSYILKLKRRIVFDLWCKESGPLKQRRINVLRSLHSGLPKDTQVDISKLETCVNNLCAIFETYKQQNSAIINKYSEWFDGEEVVNVPQVSSNTVTDL